MADHINGYLRDHHLIDYVLHEADRALKGGQASDYASAAITSLVESAARSKASIQAIRLPIRVGIVFAMYKESERLQPHSPDNPNGEDSLRRKIRELSWLFRDSPVCWHLYAVDDGCPDQSYKIATKIVEDESLHTQVTVIRLSEVLPSSRQPLCRVASTNVSMKGGAIIAGIEHAVDQGVDYVVYTDCDASVSLSQLGLLLGPAEERQIDIVLGSRVAQGSFFYWHPSRGSLKSSNNLLAHMRRRLLTDELPGGDLMSPFKLLRASHALNLIRDLQAFDYSFDVHLVAAAVAKGLNIEVCGYVFIDSFEMSTWHVRGDETIAFQKISGLLGAARQYGLEVDDSIARLIDKYINSIKDVRTILQSDAPKKLESVIDANLGDRRLIDPSEIETWLVGVFGERVLQ